MAGMNVRDDVLNKIEKPKPSGKDLAYRAVAAVFGGPVDLTAMVMKPFGYDVEKPVLGSEWIGQKMENVGLVSEARDPLQEFMASLLVPGGGIEAVLALAGKGMAMLPAAMGVVKAKGGNWLTGSAEEVLRPLKKQAGARGLLAEDVMAEMNAVYTPEAMSRLSPESLATVQRSMAELTPKVALNQWIEGPLTKYVKTRMASPDDEIRKLADQGVLHQELAPIREGSYTGVYNMRSDAGFPVRGEAKTPLANSWEVLADNALNRRLRGQFSSSTKGYEPWMENLDKNAPLFEVDQRTVESLGFRHLTDELSNALNPESGLPRALQLTPDQMKNLSVEKAVRRVADINKWRANQMAEANKTIAFDAKSAPVFKEYATVPGRGNGQPNERGLHWREIKQPTELPAGWKEYPAPKTRGGGNTIWEDPTERISYDDPKKLALEKQLKYEGDTMGHCVGGYCDAVLSGESQVYTLRDKTGKPHVTIEVNPKGSVIGYDDDDAQVILDAPRIVQIKGAKNSAPKDEYVPFIQDFIRSGKFSDVGDLQNAQLKRASQTFNKTELKTLEGYGAKLTGEEYLTKAEVEALQSLFKKARDQ